jgi:catechol 2,3-dioxygenase-like lactoylglutathione lyase family enzyme
MAKLRHIAIKSDDVDATVDFYCDVFGMRNVGGVESAGGRAVYLSDGVMNVAVFELFQTGLANEGDSGLNHLGFIVDDLGETMARLDAAGAECILAPPDDPAAGGYEVKYRGPDGVSYDISTHPWPVDAADDASAMI